MKRLFFFIALSFLISCQEKDNEKRFFNTDKLDELELDNLIEFYGAGILSNYASPFKGYYGYIDGIGYENEEKRIFVSVFESQGEALESMENRIKNVACIIEKGTSDAVDDTWWFTECIPNIVFVNKFNTIIEVGYYHDNFNQIDDILYNTANEISKRVDELSIIME
jgi:hypothetical protein